MNRRARADPIPPKASPNFEAGVDPSDLTRFQLSIATGSDSFPTTDSVSLADGDSFNAQDWHHLLATFDPAATPRVRFFLDTIPLTGSNQTTATGLITSSADMTIFADNSGYGVTAAAFHDLAIYTGTLGQGHANALYGNTGSASVPLTLMTGSSLLKAWWPGSGSIPVVTALRGINGATVDMDASVLRDSLPATGSFVGAWPTSSLNYGHSLFTREILTAQGNHARVDGPGDDEPEGGFE